MPAASQTARTRAAGDHAGAGRGRHQHHVGRAEAAFDLVRDGAAVERDLDHAARAFLDGLLDAGRNFVGLAVAPADLAAAVADDDHGREAEAAAAFDHGGAALDLHDLVDQFAAVRLPLATVDDAP